MKLNASDKTFKKDYIQTHQFLIGEYEQIKPKSHSNFLRAKVGHLE